MVSPVGTFFIVLFVLLIVAAAGWIVFTQLRARRLGLPSPPLSSYIPFARSEPSAYGGSQPSSGGIRGWFSDKFSSLRSSRSTSGAYERPSRRGFGPLDPDEAWDTRVGHEADGYYGGGGYYEEQELGYRGQGAQQQQQQQQQQQPYTTNDSRSGGSGYVNANPAADEQRGRTLSRGPAGGSSLGGSRNPFEDGAEPSNMSLRGVSPRPIDTGVAAAAGKPKGGAAHESPTSERRSIFREEV
ncbi:hypothetical protein AAE478_001711 [Parahypoxylon ruwenzoriense]